MKSYAVLEGHLLPVLWTLELAQKIVASLPSEDKYGNLLRCHEVARVVSVVLDAQLKINRKNREAMPYFGVPRHAVEDLSVSIMVIDGKFGAVDHSWVSIATGTSYAKAARQFVLDPYAVGSMPQVTLHRVDGVLAPAYSAYHAGGTREDIREDIVEELLWCYSATSGLRFSYKNFVDPTKPNWMTADVGISRPGIPCDFCEKPEAHVRRWSIPAHQVGENRVTPHKEKYICEKCRGTKDACAFVDAVLAFAENPKP